MKLTSLKGVITILKPLGLSERSFFIALISGHIASRL